MSNAEVKDEFPPLLQHSTFSIQTFTKGVSRCLRNSCVMSFVRVMPPRAGSATGRCCRCQSPAMRPWSPWSCSVRGSSGVNLPIVASPLPPHLHRDGSAVGSAGAKPSDARAAEEHECSNRCARRHHRRDRWPRRRRGTRSRVACPNGPGVEARAAAAGRSQHAGSAADATSSAGRAEASTGRRAHPRTSEVGARRAALSRHRAACRASRAPWCWRPSSM